MRATQLNLNAFDVGDFIYITQNGLCFAAYIAAVAVQSPLLPLIVSYDLISRHLLARLPISIVNSPAVRAFAVDVVAGLHGEE